MSRLEMLALLSIVLGIGTIAYVQGLPEWLTNIYSAGSSEFDGAPIQSGLATIENVTIQREDRENSAVTPGVSVRFNGYVYPVARARDWMQFKPGSKVKITYRASHAGQIQVESVEP
jgi:hypothetical protein